MREDRFKRLFGRRLKLLRELAGLTQSQLAERIGVTMQYVSMVERGLSSPSFRVIADVCRALNVDPASLFLFSQHSPIDDAARDEAEPVVLSAIDFPALLGRTAVYEFDAVTGEERWSESAVEVFGLKRAAGGISNERLRAAMHPDDRERMDRSWSAAASGGAPAVEEFRMLRNDREATDFLVRREYHRDQRGEFLRLHAVYTDVSDLKRMAEIMRAGHATLENAVRRRTEDLHQAIQELEREVAEHRHTEAELARVNDLLTFHLKNSPLCVVELDPELRFLSWSDQCKRIFGWRVGEVLGRDLFEVDLVPNSAKQDVRELVEKFRSGEISSNVFENPVLTKDGAIRYFRWFNSVRYGPDGRMASLLCMGQDITPEREAQRRLKAASGALECSEREKAAILENITEHVALYDLEHRIVWHNQRIGTLLGMAPHDIVGKRCWEIWHEHGESCQDCPVVITLRDGRPAECEAVLTDGRVALIKSFPVHDEQGRLTGVVEVGTDVTELVAAHKAIKDKDALYHAVFELNSAIKLIVDPQDGRIIEANPAACEFYGLQREELLASCITDLNVSSTDDVRTRMREARQSGRVFRFRHRAAGGRIREVEVFSGPLEFDERKLLLSIITDVNERVEAERELARQSRVQARMLDLFNTFDEASEEQHIHDMALGAAMELTDSPAGFAACVADDGTRLICTRISSDALAACHMADVPMPLEKVSGVWRVALERQDSVLLNSAEEIAAADLPEGHTPLTRMASVSARHKGKMLAQIAVANAETDYTDQDIRILDRVALFYGLALTRFRALQALKQSEREFRIVADFAVDCEMWFDADNRLRYISPACERLTGFSRDEFMADPKLFRHMVHPEDRHIADSVQLCDHGCDAGNDVKEFRIRRKDGHEVWVERLYRSVFDEGGGYMGQRASSRDITARKRGEMRRQDMERVLRHDLKSPAVTLHSGLRLLDETPLDDTQRVYVREMRHAASRLLGMLELTRQVGRMESGYYALDLHRMGLAEVLGEVSAELHVLCDEKHVAIICDIPKGVRVQADRLLLLSLLANLLRNAVEASPDGGQVAIEAVPESGGLTVSIRNTGLVPRPVREDFFGKFVTHGKSGGLGLGTYSAKLIVDAHNGYIALSLDETAETTTVSFTLPAS